ncbi:hypothetical protein ACI2KR_06535 [Pseudomonas luteola]
MNYDEAKAKADELDAAYRYHGNKLKAFPKGALGLTPDDIKSSPEYKAVKRDFDEAFSRLRAFNAFFTRQFTKEIRIDRRERFAKKGSDFESQ